MEDCIDLESDPSLIGAARAFVRSRLESWEATNWVPKAVLVASELVTNAVLHARTEIQLRLSVEEANVRIEVHDGNSRVPVPASCGVDATSGRGLALVAAVADSWGFELQGDGKVVWAELGQRDLGPESEDCLDLTEIRTVQQALDKVDGDKVDGDKVDGSSPSTLEA